MHNSPAEVYIDYVSQLFCILFLHNEDAVQYLNSYQLLKFETPYMYSHKHYFIFPLSKSDIEVVVGGGTDEQTLTGSH